MIWTSAHTEYDSIWIHHVPSPRSNVETHISMRLSTTEAMNLADALYREAHTISAVKLVTELPDE